MGFAERYETTLAEVERVAREAGRDPGDVRVIAVSKTVDVDAVREAACAGAHDFGENRPDCIMEKSAALPQESWHFIGNIQSRRIPDIVRCAGLVHSLCHESHVHKMDAAAAALGKVQDVLLEVNVSGEASKDGLAPADVPAMAQVCAGCANLRLRGLMTMAPQGDMEAARAAFEGLAKLHGQVRSQLDPQAAASFNELSMGMSEDWREAVKAGATMVRIGRALFSDDFK